MNEFILGLGVLVGILLTAFGFKFVSKKKRDGESEPIPGSIAEAARGSVQQTFEEEVEGLWDDLEGDDPAGDLTDQGNARSRR